MGFPPYVKASKLAIRKLITSVCLPPGLSGTYNHDLYGRLSAPPTKPMAGEEGFEPSNGGSKGRCLTTWRLPNELNDSEQLNHLPARRSPQAKVGRLPNAQPSYQIQSTLRMHKFSLPENGNY